MSEEYGLKFVVNGEDYDKIKKSLNKQIEDLQQKVEQQEKEIDRLNNIIDELEKVIQENKFWIYNDVLETRENFEVIDVEYILDKLKELKDR